MSDQMNSESTWGPCESAGRDKRLAQPYRLQQANRSDGEVVANGPDGLAISDNRSRINGVVVLPDGRRISSHVPILVSIVLMMRKSATNLGHCPFSARNCHPFLDHTSLT